MAALSLQYLEELMSTRLGVKRNGEVVAAETRMGPDGKEYYDIQAFFATFNLRWPHPSWAANTVIVTWQSLCTLAVTWSPFTLGDCDQSISPATNSRHAIA